MGKFAAYLNLALAVAWLALFFTNDALFVSHEVDLSDHLRGDAFAMAWAGSAICSRLYIALVNYGVELRYATAIFVIPSLAVGVLAALATSSFTSLAWAMVLLDLKILANALQGKLKVGGVIHALYTVAGVALFMTGESPVMQPGVAFLGDKFRMVWAGWKLYNVYRDDYTPHGHAVCASLAQYGGPPCPTRVEGVRIACDRVRERFRQHAPHKKKRCVPMTGKQQCEMVPGGCTN